MLKTLNVLVADDEVGVTETLLLAFRKSGHVLHAALDGEQALAKITASPDFYHVLITDHQMPKLSGLRLVEQLRKEKFPGKIIVLSGVLTPAIEEAYKTLKVDSIIRKPFEIAELREFIDGLAEETPDPN